MGLTGARHLRVMHVLEAVKPERIPGSQRRMHGAEQQDGSALCLRML